MPVHSTTRSLVQDLSPAVQAATPGPADPRRPGCPVSAGTEGHRPQRGEEAARGLGRQDLGGKDQEVGTQMYKKKRVTAGEVDT